MYNFKKILFTSFITILFVGEAQAKNVDWLVVADDTTLGQVMQGYDRDTSTEESKFRGNDRGELLFWDRQANSLSYLNRNISDIKDPRTYDPTIKKITILKDLPDTGKFNFGALSHTFKGKSVEKKNFVGNCSLKRINVENNIKVAPTQDETVQGIKTVDMVSAVVEEALRDGKYRTRVSFLFGANHKVTPKKRTMFEIQCPIQIEGNLDGHNAAIDVFDRVYAKYFPKLLRKLLTVDANHLNRTNKAEYLRTLDLDTVELEEPPYEDIQQTHPVVEIGS